MQKNTTAGATENLAKDFGVSQIPVIANCDNLIVADGLCPEISELLPGSLHKSVALGLVNNPLSTIAKTLANAQQIGQPIQTLHIVAHGRSGAFFLGGQWIDSATLIKNAQYLAQWKVERIALWNCLLGSDQDFVSLLAELTGAQIFETSDYLGTFSGKRNWTIINASSGNTLRGETIFSEKAINNWSGNLATKVAVFNQAGLNGSGVGSSADENANLLSIVQKLIDDGKDYEIELGITSFTIADLETRLSDASFFFMTDMESGDPTDNSFFPEAAVDILKAFVEGGGVIVMTGTAGSNDVDFLNRIFDWDLGSTGGSSWTLDTAAAAGTPFEAGPASLSAPSATDSISRGTVENFTAIYGDDTNATVAVIKFGAGTVIFQGFDFYNSGFATDYGEGTHADGGQNTNDWVTEILPRSLEFATTLAVNGAPSITSSDTVSVDENSTAVLTVTANDPEDDALTFSLTGGADQALFSINSTTGELSFSAAPDFETPGDADNDNVYEVEVSVDDSNSGVTTQTINVTVTDTNENGAPSITSSATASVAENSTAVLTVTADDSENDALTFALIGGADQAMFAIDSATGELSFSLAPDFETPGDADSDNVYEVEVSVDDSNGGITTQSLGVTVTDIAESDPLIQFSLSQFSSNLEIGYFIVDDPNGNIGNLAPGDAGYLSAALAQSTLLFSALPADANLMADINATSTRAVNANSYLGFFSIDGSINSFLNSGDGTVSLLDIEAATTVVSSDFSLSIGDITLSATETEALPIGVGLQGNMDANIIDLTQITEAVTATFTVQREAAFDNVVGFYVIDDLTGLVTDSEGNTFAPGDSGYTAAALNQRIADISLSAGNNSTAQFSGTLEANQIIAPFLIVDGTLEALLDESSSNDPQIYFPFLGANSDGVDHMRLFGDNTMGFEDIVGGGDYDYDDVLIQIDFA